jgi:hypothetical protein
MEACLENIEMNQGKVETKVEAYLEEMKVEIIMHRRTDMGNGV